MIANKKIIYTIMLSTPFIFLFYLGNILIKSAYVDLLSFFVITYTAMALFWTSQKATDYRLNWVFISVAAAIWALGDFLWFLYDLSHINNGFISYWIEYFYTLSNVFLLGSAILYFKKNIQKWHAIQLALDMGIIVLILVITSTALFIPIFSSGALIFSERALVITMMVTDFSILAIMITLISSARHSPITPTMRFLLAGFLMFCTVDLIFTYQYAYNLYSPNKLIDALYLLSFVLMMVACLYDRLYPNTKQHFETVTLDNIGHSRVMWWVVMVTGLLALLHILPINFLGLIFAGVLSYYLASYYLQKSLAVERLYNLELTHTMQLETLVAERTAQLMKLNTSLEQKARIDDLTQLMNRRALVESITHKIQVEPVDETAVFSVFHIDLDRFKVINDLHGHEAGDGILIAIAQRLKQHLGGDHILARVGGDEFCLLSPIHNREELTHLSKEIVSLFQEPFYWSQYNFYVQVHIGVALYPQDGHSAMALLKSAEIATHHAKNGSKMLRYALYESELVAHIERKNLIEGLLRQASLNDHFQVYYQPQFCAHTQQLLGMEALIRWRNPEYGFISPAEFIPIAESSGFINELTQFVMQTAIKQIYSWNTRFGLHYKMGVNLSPLLIDSIDFAPKLIDLCERAKIQPGWLDLEITENAAMNVNQQATIFFTSMRQYGIHISIDDFGTGYSSLAYIKQFSVDTLKIAKELVDSISTQEQDRLIVKAIIMMAQAMELKTIAEGVETQEQLSILSTLRCDAIQGYLLGKPMDATLFEKKYFTDSRGAV